MRTLFSSIPLAAAVLLSTAITQGQPPQGSQLPLDDNTCATCHGEEDLWEGETLRLHVSHESLADDVHWKEGVNCHDCHGGDPSSFDVPEAHATEADEGSGVQPFRAPLSEIRKVCVNCHQEQAGMDTGVHTLKDAQGDEEEPLAADCRMCHGDDAHQILSQEHASSPTHLANRIQLCGECHQEQQAGMDMGVHAPENAQGDGGKPLPTDCGKCHGDNVHQIFSSEDARALTYPTKQVQLCGKCHQEELKEYETSVHGHGLMHAGLVVTAVCSDCHDAHSILPASEPESTLHATKVAETCAKCHRFIEERLKMSVHGKGSGPGGSTEKAAPGGEIHRKPSCTDCHEGHDLPHPNSKEFHLGVAHRCGKCHTGPSDEYLESIHGKLTDLGYAPAAACSDCHGAHDIVPLDDPQSPVAAANRRATCMQCHESLAANLVDFDPHANPKDRERNPLVYYCELAMELLLFSVFSFFGVHTLLWFVRSIVDVRRHGRPKGLEPGEVAYRRFKPVHRSLHVIIIISFLGLAATGLPLKYSGQPWAQDLVHFLGGFGSTGVWHRIFGVVTFFYFGTHLIWLVGKTQRLQSSGDSWLRIVFGPDSPVPTPRDIKDVFRMMRWFLGKGPKPGFERWAYWEKFDYWAVFWGVGIIGTSGLVLWFPNLFCWFLPGQVLNIAKVIHSEEALLATGFVFAVHFFHSHVRAEKFPMDMSIFTGLVSEEEFQEERPEFYERMRSEGKLRESRVSYPRDPV